MTKEKIPVGILGATGMVGQRFVALLENHPWLSVAKVAASSHSAGKNYKDATSRRWVGNTEMPEKVGAMKVLSITDDIDEIVKNVKLVFCAISAPKEGTIEIENSYAAAGVPVVSNNSANRWTPDVPMIMPEINADHLDMIETQQKNRGWDSGFIVTKPNCSIQGYVPLIRAWEKFIPQRLVVSTYQALSGAGRTTETWPEMNDNVIPFIVGEEEKSQQEPMKILGTLDGGKLKKADTPSISANCVRVPVSDGHLATINIEFEEDPTKTELIEKIKHFVPPTDVLNLPSAPRPFITYFSEDDRPQTRLDRDIGNGMGISVGRLRKDPVLGWKCISLAHNTIRGAAGGAILTAELLVSKGYVN